MPPVATETSLAVGALGIVPVSAPIDMGQPTVTVNGLAVATISSTAGPLTVDAPIDPIVTINGLPIAALGSPVAPEGAVTSGIPTVEING